MSTNRQIHVLDELQSLLEEQIKLAQRGNAASRRIEVLSKQADALVGKIVQTGMLESSEFKNRREHLKKLYDTLCLAVTVQKADTATKLNQVRRGKKTITTYRSNI
jgi:CRISPR/Cas system CSM-associated protein Csm2 small subunit